MGVDINNIFPFHFEDLFIRVPFNLMVMHIESKPQQSCVYGKQRDMEMVRSVWNCEGWVMEKL